MCRHCEHLIGYHWIEDEKCTVKDCECPGYEESDEKKKPLPLPIMSNLSSKLKVEIGAPEHGWTHVKLDSEDLFYEFFPSDVPMDSISELVKAILEILSGNNQSVVFWNDEPVEHNFIFKVENEFCDFKVYKVSKSVAGRDLEERFSFRDTKYEVLRPFWKALCDLNSKQSLDEYEKHWGNSFPTNETIEIEQKLQSLK